MYKSIIKIICLLIVASLGWVGILAIGQTLARFNDIEISKDNNLQAGTLDLYLTVISEEDENNEIEIGDDEVKKTIKIINKGNLSFRYIVRVEKISGDIAFCNALQLKAELEEKKEEEYNVNLIDFRSTFREFDQNNSDVWDFEIYLPDNSRQNKTCEFRFVFEGWQIYLDFPLGFSDREETESISINNNDNNNKNDNKNDENGDEGSVSVDDTDETNIDFGDADMDMNVDDTDDVGEVSDIDGAGTIADTGDTDKVGKGEVDPIIEGALSETDALSDTPSDVLAGSGNDEGNRDEGSDSNINNNESFEENNAEELIIDKGEIFNFQPVSDALIINATSTDANLDNNLGFTDIKETESIIIGSDPIKNY